MPFLLKDGDVFGIKIFQNFCNKEDTKDDSQ